jgi:hypothetical protein
MKAWIIIIILLFLLSLITGCQDETIYLRRDVCRQPGTYCHVFIVNGGTVNITFPSVINGTFNFTIET